MRDIKHAEEVFSAYLKKKIEKLKEAQRDTATKIWKDVVNAAPTSSGAYISSIQLGETEQEGNTIKTSVYSDLLVGGDIPKWQNVPLAAFMEWGTGPLGESTNTFEHGYSYTTTAPWNFIAQMQYEQTGTWGIVAHPHFFPSLQNNVALYKENIKKALGDD